jgi:hypothetical protein
MIDALMIREIFWGKGPRIEEPVVLDSHVEVYVTFVRGQRHVVQISRGGRIEAFELDHNTVFVFSYPRASSQAAFHTLEKFVYHEFNGILGKITVGENWLTNNILNYRKGYVEVGTNDRFMVCESEQAFPMF